MSTDKKAGIGRRVAKASLYMIPGYPLIKAAGSLKATAGSGLETLRELKGELDSSKKTRTRRVRTWNEAIANRSPDALPLETIERDCLWKKRLCLAFAFICASYALGGLIGANFMPIFSGLLGVGFPSLFIVREEHRLWQMEVGPQHPDEPLPGYRQFFRTPGVALRLINPRLF